MRILTIGHSYCVVFNRGIVRDVAQDGDFEISVASPRYFHGDLRPITVKSEPPDSLLRVVPLDTQLSRCVHIFRYYGAALKTLLPDQHFDLVHACEEPYILAGYEIACALQDTYACFCFRTGQSYVMSYPPPFGYVERSVLSRAQAWTAGASLVFEAMLSKGFPKEKGRVLNMAVDLSQFQPLSDSDRKDAVRRIWLAGPRPSSNSSMIPKNVIRCDAEIWPAPDNTLPAALPNSIVNSTAGFLNQPPGGMPLSTQENY